MIELYGTTIFIMVVAAILGIICAELVLRGTFLLILSIDKYIFKRDYSNCDCGKPKCGHRLKRITI